MIYPNSTPEFRFLKKSDGSMIFQVRYINPVQGYTSAWSDVPIVEEQTEEKVNG